MISTYPAQGVYNADFKCLSDRCEEFSAMHFKCPTCNAYTFTRINSSESFVDEICVKCNRKREDKSIRLQGIYKNATLKTLNQTGFKVRLGSLAGFYSLFVTGHTDLGIMFHTYETLQGYSLDDHTSVGIINQVFKFGVMLSKTTIKKICAIEGVILENEELLTDDNPNAPLIRFVIRGNKVDLYVLRGGLNSHFEIQEPRILMRTDKKKHDTFQQQTNDAQLLVDVGDQMERQSKKTKKYKRKLAYISEKKAKKLRNKQQHIATHTQQHQ